MPEPQTYVEFDAGFPDDQIWDEDDNLIQAGGRNVLVAIADMLAALGLQVSEPYEHSCYGWAVDATNGLETFWFLIQYPEPWLLLSQDKTGLLRGWRRKQSGHGAVMLGLKAAIARDPRFSKARWFTKAGYEASGPADEQAEA